MHLSAQMERICKQQVLSPQEYSHPDPNPMAQCPQGQGSSHMPPSAPQGTRALITLTDIEGTAPQGATTSEHVFSPVALRSIAHQGSPCYHT